MNDYKAMDYDELDNLANMDDEEAIQELENRLKNQVKNHTPKKPSTNDRQ